jgi:membrane associated rhomboid family serine protease
MLFGTGIGERLFGSPDVLMVGASGAIFGLVGIIAMIIPQQRVYLILGPIIALVAQVILEGLALAPIVYTIVSVIINVYILVALFTILSFNPKLRKISLPVAMPMWALPLFAILPLLILGLIVALPIGNFAHLGGLICGLLYGAYLRRKFSRKVRVIQRMYR